MKKKMFLGIAACFFVATVAINIGIAEQIQGHNTLLANIAVMAQAQTELPEVTITCSSGNDGQCYMEGEPHHYIGPLGLPMCETTCDWTGSQTDFCASGMPC